MNKTIAIGFQDFSYLRENNYFYIDKTGFIKEWWANGDSVMNIIGECFMDRVKIGQERES